MKHTDYVTEAHDLFVSMFKGKQLRVNSLYGDFEDGYFDRGAFRVTFIPDNAPFVVKTGYNRGGREQCVREKDYYDKAVEAGLENYFATCYGTFVYREKTFYVFEKIEHIGEYGGRYHRRMSDYARRKGLEKFLNDNDIGDLHCNNYGKRGRSFVITDYAGAHSSDWVK